jgi:UDP-MurNAc hydroxylase
MKIHFLKSATTIIESDDVKILTDPWLVDGEYYGSWFHYPPYDFDPKTFDDIDFIYISHIHPDHFSRATLSQLNKDIPVLIHNYDIKFLKRNIESLGFSVREFPNNQYFCCGQLQSRIVHETFRVRQNRSKVWLDSN